MIILKNYLDNKNRKMIKNDCPSNKIINPKTGRCILKSGLIAKKLIFNIINDSITYNKKNNKINIGLITKDELLKLVEYNFVIITDGCSLFNKFYKIMIASNNKKYPFIVILYDNQEKLIIALFENEKEADKYYFSLYK